MNRSGEGSASAAAGRLSRRRAMQSAGAALALGAASRASGALAQEATPVVGQPLPPAVTEVMAKSIYPPFTIWGIHVADRATGEVLYDLDGIRRYVPGSTTKLFPAAAALTAYGADYRFETPVYAVGEVSDGTLSGDLVLVASGDITMGGRDLPDGTIAHGFVDHTDANAAPGIAVLSETDPLAGLNILAQQVADAGITNVDDVVIDARLWAQMAKDDYILTPIMINDNVIDLVTTPGKAGEPATLEWRPHTAMYSVRTEAVTVAKGEPLGLTVDMPSPSEIVVKGQIAEGSDPILQTAQVADPQAFARTLFIEALQRHGITTIAPAVGANPDRLPTSYAEDTRVAVLDSLPFSQVIKLILKVSHNQGADTLVYLLAVHEGKNTFDDGMAAIKPFLTSIGVDPSAVSLGDGRGNARSDLFSPRSVADLLRAMASHPEAEAYAAALPILGVDGTEWTALPKTSPALGKITAKSGTTIDGDLLNQEYLLLGKASAGYMTSKSGKDLVWAIYVNDLLSPDLFDLIAVGDDIGEVAEAIWEAS